MRIFEIILFQYILGYILQGFAYCLGIYAFCMKKVEVPKYIIASGMFIVISFLTRLLPVSFGVHTILDLICLFLLGLLFLKMPALSSIRSILAITILLIVTELLSLFFMTNIIGPEQVNAMMNDSLGKAIIALPSSIIFAVLIVMSYIVLLNIKKKKSVKHGEDGT